MVILLIAGLVVAGVFWYLLESSSSSHSTSSLQLPAATSSEVQSSSTFSINISVAQGAAAAALAQLSQYPFLSLTPVDRSINASTFPTSAQQFTYEGISLKLPWSGTPQIQSRQGVGTQIKFADGDFVMLANPYPDQLIRQEFMSSIKTTDDQAKFNYLFGQDNLQSNVLFFNLVLNSSLQSLTSSTLSPQELFAQSMLLPIKLTLFFDSSAQAIYRFSTPNFRVFEITDLPLKNQSYIFLYDDQDNGRLITTSANQEDIDFILASAHNQ